MESAPPPPDLEASLLQRWFLVSPPGKSALKEHKCFSEIDLRDISDVLRRVGQGAWSRIPRIYVVLRLLDRLDVIDLFLAQAISDIYFPFTHQSLPQSLNPSVAHEFLQVQRVVLSSALDLERETGRHRHFPSADDVPFIKVEELGKGAYGYVDRVISTVSHREYARKLIPRGRTFQRDKKILRDFERELGTLKKLRHHRHIVQLVGSYTDPRFVGIIMSPVAEGDLKDFLNDCASDAKGNPHSRKSFTRSFFGCLTSALSYLHDNTIRHKDIKPQNVLVSQHTIYLTDFGISLDWSEIGHSTTTGPTPKTARYCAPEVSEYEPRNTSSDMWSLGCVFLEIWTVLKGETVANLHAFLEANLTLSSCYHLNTEATFQWMKNLESKPTLADNPPLDWIRHLLVEDKGKRWTARQLLSEIETVNSNPEAKFAFSGQCCIEGLESAESVISSNASFSESATNDYVPQPPPPVPSLSLSQNKEERPEAHSGASQLQRNSSPSDLNDSTSNSFDNNPEPDSTTIMSESIITPPASRITLASVPKDEDAVLLAVGESPERKSHAGRSENSAPDLDQTQLKTQVDDLGRAQSTHPEISLARPPMVESSSLSTRPVPVEHFSLSSDASKDGATDSGERTRSEMLDEKSIAGAHEHVEWTSSSSSPNVERTSPSTTSGKEDLQHQHNRSGDTVEEDIKLTAPEYYISRAEDPITMDANTQRIAFPAPYQSITFSPDNHATSIHQSEDHSQIIPKASSNEHKMDQSNATTLIEPASRSTDITSPADISRIAYNVQDISRLEGSVIPTYISSEPDATRHPTRLDQETIPPPPTKPNETGVNKQQTGPVDYMASQSQKTRGESSPSTTSSTDVLANEVASRDQASSDHVLEPQKVKTENHDISVDAEWPLVQPDTPRELGSSPSPSRPDAPVFGSSRNEDLQRLDQTKIPSTELVPYAHPEVPRANNETSLICGKCYERLTGKFVRAFSMRFHLECFTCPDCEEIVASKFFPTEGKIIGGRFLPIANPPQGHTQQIPLCETDYFRRLDLLCHTCGAAIRGSYVTALNHKYHLEHFICSEPGCGKVFEASDHYYEYDGAVFCKKHCAQHGEICHGCETPIFKQFVEIFRNGQNEMWHPECYMIHKYWNVRLKNEFAGFFIKREQPKQNGLEVPQDLVETSMNRTEELMAKIWSVLSTFEESCATSILDMYQNTMNSNLSQALLASVYFIFKIEGYFIALDQLDRLKQAKEETGTPMTLKQKLLCKKLAAFFKFVASVCDTRPELTEELLSLITGLAHYMKLLIRIGLKAAISLDPHNKGSLIPSFLTNVEKITGTGMQLDLQQRFQNNDYFSGTADLCALCGTTIDDNPGQGCYWTHAYTYHVDCINCPSCNGPPKLVYADGGKSFVECSRCSYGSMMAFITQNFGQKFVILHSKSLVFTHLLYITWARVTATLRPEPNPPLLILAEASSENSEQENVHEGSANSNGIPSTPSCPQGWKAYWSSPAGKYLFMNLVTGISQWEFPASGDSSNNPASSSQEIVTHRPAPSHNTQNPDWTTNPEASTQYSIALDDIPRMFAAEQARARGDRLMDAPGGIFKTARQAPSPTNRSNTPSHRHSQEFDGVPQIILSPMNGSGQTKLTTDSGATSFERVDVPTAEKKKSSFFNKWRKGKSKGVFP